MINETAVFLVPCAFCTPQDVVAAEAPSPPPGTLTFPSPPPPPKSIQESVRSALSARGLPGLVNVPIASSLPDGSYEVTFSTISDREGFPRANRENSMTVAVALLPRLTLTGRGVVPVNDETKTDVARDLSANAQFLVLKDESWWPAIAVGAQDVGGAASHLRTYYGVVSKTLFGSLRLTAGVGRGPDVLKGPFGGAELAVNPFLTVMTEYDGKRVTPAFRLFPLPEKWEQKGVPRPTVDVVWNEGREIQWQLAVRGPLSGHVERFDDAADREPPPKHARRTDGASALTIVRDLQAELIKRGLENVRVSVRRIRGGRRVTVDYENRRWNRDELDAVGIVLGVALVRTPADVTEIRAIVHKVNVPVLAVTVDAEVLRSYLDEEMADEEFARDLDFVEDGTWLVEGTPPEATTDTAERSWAKLDVFARPEVDTQLLTEVGVADARFTVLPDAYTQLLPGAVVNIEGEIPVARTPHFFQPLGTAGVRRVLLHQAFPLPIGRLIPTTAAITQVSIGRFARDTVGVQHETSMSVLDGYGLLKATWACLGTTYAHLESPRHCLALGNARVRWPVLDTKLSVTAGRFLDGDRGVAGDLSRFFGDTEVGVFLRHSDLGNLAGIRVALPLTPSKELRPYEVRPRLPDVYSYEQRSVVFESKNIIRNDIGRELVTDHSIEDAYWNRDRLYPAYIREHVRTLRDAFRSWGDEDDEGSRK